ncbi:YibE/F family protein [Marinisporobacter balticus]|uniref:YibE/F-like protein n=1 Tax=Marinisporobacter balticus TaxID=2018667 RepID=A0A4R2KRD7_9FIRM|nr:YibE/F family protein [Marinisporobacter balticus]TCO72698.1 YibE/F-like protein [Marinisporobacter balticus]
MFKNKFTPWIYMMGMLLIFHLIVPHLAIDRLLKEKISLLYLFVIFLGGLLIVGGFKGLKAIFTLIFTIWAIVKVLLPMILKGYNPIVVSTCICAVVIIITLLIVCGINKKTLSAIIGTTGGVIIAGVLSLMIGSMANLTGLGNEESVHLILYSKNIDFKGLLFSGIIIGSLGATMDVGMSVASAMHEIKQASPKITTDALISAGMNVGRDIMGTMSNTLILAYVGSSLNLMLLLSTYDISLIQIITRDHIASEVIRALAGSIGLIFTIPLTAIVSGVLSKSEQVDRWLGKINFKHFMIKRE